jgi:hypothetical protein
MLIEHINKDGETLKEARIDCGEIISIAKLIRIIDFLGCNSDSKDALVFRIDSHNQYISLR